MRPKNIIVEPVARGTTAALALAVATIHERDPQALVFALASDHSVTEIKKFHAALRDAFSYVARKPKDIVLLGIKPTRVDTNLGYIQHAKKIQQKPAAFAVRSFIEKPDFDVARKLIATGTCYWNAAYYFFKAATLLDAYRDADPAIVETVAAYRKSGDPAEFAKAPEKNHEIGIIDAKKYKLVLFPAHFTWSDIGNWHTLHEILSRMNGKDLVASGAQHIDVNSGGTLVLSQDNKLIATVGLHNIVIVNTPDALLVLNKERPQDVKKVIAILRERGLSEYL